MESTQKTVLLLVAALTLLLTAASCKKVVLEFLGGQFVGEIWEDRPESIPCTPAASPLTLDNQELTFSPNHMLCIEVDMDAADFEVMRNESRFGPSVREDDGAATTAVFLEYIRRCDVPFPSEYNWYSADVLIDGFSLKEVGIRKKGFLGSIFSDAPPIKINTDYYQGGNTIGNTNKVTLNNNAEDVTRVLQCLNYGVFGLADYPAPRCNLANVSINGEALGVYSHLEAIDETFLQRNFGNSNGHLYEGQLADFRSKWLPRWDAKTDATDEVGVPLLGIIDVLEESEDETLLEDLENHLNLDRFMTYWALEVLLDHDDGYAANRNNFFIYLDPDDGDRITFIPWGMNSWSEDRSTDLGNHVNAELPRRLSRIPEISDRFDTEMNRLLDEVWDETTLDSLVNHYAVQVQSGQMDPDYEDRLDRLKEWIQNRRGIIENALQDGLPEGNKKVSKTCYNSEG